MYDVINFAVWMFMGIIPNLLEWLLLHISLYMFTLLAKLCWKFVWFSSTAMLKNSMIYLNNKRPVKTGLFFCAFVTQQLKKYKSFGLILALLCWILCVLVASFNMVKSCKNHASHSNVWKGCNDLWVPPRICGQVQQYCCKQNIASGK